MTDPEIFGTLTRLHHQGHVFPERHTSESRYTVRLYDGMDGCWMDVGADLSLSEAFEVWMGRTKDGTESTCYANIDYYSIFPADTRMIYTEPQR